MPRLPVLLALCGCGLLGRRLDAQTDVLRRAMQDELTRSMQGLHLDTMPKPYFIAYRIDESDQLTVTASRGSVLHSARSHGRVLTVEVRIGDYSFDNTNFFAFPTDEGATALVREFAGETELPLDDDYGALRRQIWLATDVAYKAAVEQYSRKRSARGSGGRAGPIPDFSPGEVTTTTDTLAAAPATIAEAESFARGLSKVPGEAPEIEHSDVSVTDQMVRSIYVNSEGSAFTRSLPYATVTIEASTRAQDGMPLAAAFNARARSLRDLPSADSLATAARGLVSRLATRKQGAIADVYHGPVLFSGEAAAQVFRAQIGSRLVAERRPAMDNPAFEQMLAQHDNSFLDELGARVLPRFLSVSDNPTLTTYAGHFVGGFRVDDDGVRTRETLVIDHGVLKTLLSTRIPVRGVPRSSGNRREEGPTVSTLVVTADSGLSAAALKQRLLSLVAARGLPYGIIVRHLGAGGGEDGDNPFAALAAMAAAARGSPTFEAEDVVRVYPDGHEEPIRGAAISDLSTAAFRDVVAASRSATVYSGMAGFPALPFELPAFFRLREALVYPSTYVVPDLLFEDISLKGSSAELPPLPVVPPPWSSGGHEGVSRRGRRPA